MTNRVDIARGAPGNAAPTADLVLRNGAIWCGRNDGMAESVAVWQGRVLATGSDDAIAPLIGPSTRVIDLRRKVRDPRPQRCASASRLARHDNELGRCGAESRPDA